MVAERMSTKNRIRFLRTTRRFNGFGEPYTAINVYEMLDGNSPRFVYVEKRSRTVVGFGNKERDWKKDLTGIDNETLNIEECIDSEWKWKDSQMGYLFGEKYEYEKDED